jgi:hypothetical protein
MPGTDGTAWASDRTNTAPPAKDLIDFNGLSLIMALDSLIRAKTDAQLTSRAKVCFNFRRHAFKDQLLARHEA